MLLNSLQLKKNIPIDAYDKHIKERADLESILEALLNERIDSGHIEVVTFQKRIIKLRDYLFTFLYHKEVPAENNASERAIRNVKVKQKVSSMIKVKTGVIKLYYVSIKCRYMQ